MKPDITRRDLIKLGAASAAVLATGKVGGSVAATDKLGVHGGFGCGREGFLTRDWRRKNNDSFGLLELRDQRFHDWLCREWPTGQIGRSP